ncbi:RNA 2',3'-cyclic phosphodiesterase [Deferribacteraceae bacterium V6Fe1]|nr:RNA 2',3'-cyclic phosphodiesterase [Deferribacteraceae bacterium V6Fe1]
MRCFIAIKPPLDISKFYYNHILRYKGFFTGNIVKPEQMHITLFFFNNLSDSQKDFVCDTLKQFREYKSFQVALGRYDFFYREKIPTVCFVKASSPELFKLREDMAVKLNILPFDRKPFKAHLTLSRIKKVESRDNLDRFLSESELKYFNVNEILFIKSELTSVGPIYTNIYNLKLMR